MVKNGCQFNENRLLKVSKIISSIIDGFCYNSFTELFLEEIRQRCPIRATAGILSTPHWRDLSVIEDKGLLNDILGILIITIQLTTPDSLRYISTTTDTDPQSIRNVVLHEVLIPMEQRVFRKHALVGR
ncbi:hypothetical protein BLNAU_10449 [Blattamonas nauphoetae]|uniref:Uncharacterized protein n=1 Tax=Blattamonas nauphoetae TaxID=2049346 RepID=A0ABQ9XQB0_9EUKA|nr:hypothetical protein BLNAU_10449 [Blattamonas nauphoetae]